MKRIKIIFILFLYLLQVILRTAAHSINYFNSLYIEDTVAICKKKYRNKSIFINPQQGHDLITRYFLRQRLMQSILVIRNTSFPYSQSSYPPQTLSVAHCHLYLPYMPLSNDHTRKIPQRALASQNTAIFYHHPKHHQHLY